VTTPFADRRLGWALPPQPPENWVGSRWAVALLVALVAAAGIPALALREDRTTELVSLVALHAAAGCAALITGYVLMIQASVTGDRRLRWMASAYIAIWPLALLRAAEVEGSGPLVADVERAALLGLLWMVTIPAMALLWPLVRGGASAALIPLSLVAAATVAVLLLPSLPELVRDDQSRTAALRAAWLALGLVAGVAAVRWQRTTTRGAAGTWSWIGAGLALTTLAGLVLGLAEQRYDALWWAGHVVLVLALVVPAAGLSLISAAGYRRQSIAPAAGPVREP
jgi:hypothetical protein